MMKIGTITILKMGRSKAQRAEHLLLDHEIEVAPDATYDEVVKRHSQAHSAYRDDPDAIHRHTDSCPACFSRSPFHSCQFQATGTYEVQEGTTNRKVCLACADKALKHTCGLARLQKMLSW